MGAREQALEEAQAEGGLVGALGPVLAQHYRNEALNLANLWGNRGSREGGEICIRAALMKAHLAGVRAALAAPSAPAQGGVNVIDRLRSLVVPLHELETVRQACETIDVLHDALKTIMNKDSRLLPTESGANHYEERGEFWHIANAALRRALGTEEAGRAV